jgi:Flp pilus assembly protein TadB
MVNVLISILVVAVVWVLTGALGMPYLVSLVVTILAALYIFSEQGLLPPHRAHRRPR